MLTGLMFDNGVDWTFVGSLFSDLVVIIPIALGVMASLWGLRLAISYFKGIAR